MGINRSSFSAEPLSQNTDVTIRLVSARPNTAETLEVPVQPNILTGFYNDATDEMELYISDFAGLRYIKVS